MQSSSFGRKFRNYVFASFFKKRNETSWRLRSCVMHLCDKVWVSSPHQRSLLRMWLSKLPQWNPRSAAKMVGKVTLYFQHHFKNWSKFIRVFSFKSTSGSFDETMLFTVVGLLVELTEKQRGCNFSLSRKHFDVGERARKDLMRDISNFDNRWLNSLWILSMISKQSAFQIQTLTFIVNSDMFCYEWRPFWMDTTLTFCACLEGGITLVDALIFAVFFQTLHLFLIF